MIDVSETQVRARVLRLGFGDAVGHGPSLDEVESRVLRLLQYAEALPRYRLHGAVRLDLLARDAFVVGRAVGLHPRGFALLWRLTEHPGETVGTPELLYDVWRLSFRPETHSLAAHLSRLRTKLRTAGVDGLETCPGATTCCAARTGKPPPRLRPNSHWTITPVCARSRSQHWPECRIIQHGLDRYPAGSRSHRHR